ncbi:MAG: hypothetical protein EB829_01950 [Nitrosopumilus sp. H8]|nr:MAG: hypothetical protein EB829_01950 [Nitrosopumilus sp. H8]
MKVSENCPECGRKSLFSECDCCKPLAPHEEGMSYAETKSEYADQKSSENRYLAYLAFGIGGIFLGMIASAFAFGHSTCA